ncbi:MAG: TIGR02530 family flagellar biosynthesis protein [Balneolaceae bacterium]|jgi:flagellar operon protein
MDIRHLTGRISPDAFPLQTEKGANSSIPQDGASFKEVLKEASGLEFSGHALKRLQDRSISMGESDMKRLQEAVSRAEEKGSRDSLILDGDQAFLVNIPNKTVVTAVDMMELRDRVFTNIDSTVLTKQF